MSVESRDRDNALVIGGSIAGLCAARVLADHFRRVSVIERDTFAATSEPRRGVPQALHVHVLMRRGYLALEQLFPGIGAELEAACALYTDWTADSDGYSSLGRGPRFSSGITSYCCTRGLIEHIVYGRVAALPNVALAADVEVSNLTFAGAKGPVVGARVRARGAREAAERSLDCDLLVDASGRTSRLPQWLAQAGYAPPAETIVDSKLGYATGYVRPQPGYEPDWNTLIVRDPPPHGLNGGVIMRVEGGQWIVTLSGRGNDKPPIDAKGFLAFVRGLIHPALADALARAEPASGIVGYALTANRLRHYEQPTPRPGGFVAIGDAVCAFNPLYGQGMTTAVLEAQVLDLWLRRDDPPLAFQKTAANLLRTPWRMATGTDRRLPGVEISGTGGQTSRVVGALDKGLERYMDRVQRLTAREPSIRLAFTRVLHLVAPPASLFSPRVAARVLRG